MITACAALALACGEPARPDASVALDPSARPARRERVRAFYSGHSLSDGVPEEVQRIGASLAALGKPADFDFQFQSDSGALIVQRGPGRTLTKGTSPLDTSTPYRFGRSRGGVTLDVADELRSPKTLAPGERYDVLVITERHDLPWTAFHDETAIALRHYYDTFMAGSPGGDVLLYQTWLAIEPGRSAAWRAYENDALVLWECVASAVNRALPAGARKVRVLPGASALAELVGSFVDGTAPGVTGSEAERLALIFSDDVHLSALGHHFMGLVHYAALFGVSPEGAAAPDGIAPELASFMQRLAWRHVAGYAPRAEAGAARSMRFCRDYAANVMCPAFYSASYGEVLFGGGDASFGDRLRAAKHKRQCAPGYADAADPRNPFPD